MIKFTKGNLLEADVDALVNTVNAVGVMGKGIALMFKERFPDNFQRYASACRAGQVRAGKLFITAQSELSGPKWIVNFATKDHWKGRSRLTWIESGLDELRAFIVSEGVASIAIPPLGAGNGGLNWAEVKALIEQKLASVPNVNITVFEPSENYQNVAKREGVERLTPARALIAELVRRYWVLGMECTLLEIQKLAWFLESSLEKTDADNPLKLEFVAHRYGPFANKLTHLLNSLDGSYLHCSKRISDAGPLDIIWFDDARKVYLETYLKSEALTPYRNALERTAKLIDGFESPFGMELLATIHWLVEREGVSPRKDEVRRGISKWGGGAESAERKQRLFDDRSIEIALKRLNSFSRQGESVTAPN